MTTAIISNLQNKGGDGKTCLTRLEAEYLSKLGKRVLLIDLDPQCNLSSVMIEMDHDGSDTDGRMPPVHEDYPDEDNPAWDGRYASSDIFMNRPLGTYQTRLPGVEIMPGRGKYLAAAERRELEKVTNIAVDTKKVHNAYKHILRTEAFQKEFDYILVDTPPAKGHLTQAAIRAATHLVIPVTAEKLSFDGMVGMIQLWRREQTTRTDEPTRLAGIVVNKFKQKTALHEQLYQDLKDNEAYGPWVLPHVLGNRVAFAEGDHPDTKPRSVFELPRSNPARKEAEAVMEAIFESIDSGQVAQRAEVAS